VPPEDAESLLALTEFEINAVGTIGDIKKNADGSLSWSIRKMEKQDVLEYG
jgi:hypothetical protein